MRISGNARSLFLQIRDMLLRDPSYITVMLIMTVLDGGFLFAANAVFLI